MRCKESDEHSRERPSHLNATAGTMFSPNQLLLSWHQQIFERAEKWVAGWRCLENFAPGA
jgi:hypothetical protein